MKQNSTNATKSILLVSGNEWNKRNILIRIPNPFFILVSYILRLLSRNVVPSPMQQGNLFLKQISSDPKSLIAMPSVLFNNSSFCFKIKTKASSTIAKNTNPKPITIYSPNRFKSFPDGLSVQILSNMDFKILRMNTCTWKNILQFYQQKNMIFLPFEQ